MTIQKQFSQFKTTFDPLFRAEVKRIIERQISFGGQLDHYDSELINAVTNYSADGKRVRPFLIHAFAEKDLDDIDIQHACLASELVHLFAIIHDDIMDDDDFRRGNETIHFSFTKLQEKNQNLGRDIAILIGDVYLSEAHRHVAQLTKPLQELFFTMIEKTVRGQYLDVIGMNAEYGDANRDVVFDCHYLKTAWYTLATPILVGAELSGSYSEDEMQTIKKNALSLGLLYQIRDDIKDCIDIESGKELYGDIFENQTTWVTLLVKNEFSEQWEQLINAKEKYDTNALNEIFTQIDLKACYHLEFQKRVDEIALFENPELKHKFQGILHLLEL